MFDTIQKNLPVSWCVEFSNGERWFDDGQERSWIRAKKLIKDRQLTIKQLFLFATVNAIDDTNFNGACTPPNSPGVFFCKKLVCGLGGPVMHYYAIGHQVNDNTLSIRWYTDTMELIETEERDISRGTLGYIEANND
jgi:hypothetical protein